MKRVTQVTCILNCLLFGFITILATPTSRALAADATRPHDGFTTTTTHIEADPWRMLRIERPESELPAPAATPTTDTQGAYLHGNWFGLFGIDTLLAPPNQGGHEQFVHAWFLKVNFFEFWINRRDGSLVHNAKRPVCMNWYWFALCDGIVEKQAEKNALGGNSRYVRLGFVDSPVFTACKIKFDAPRHVYWEALDLPLSTTLSHETDTDMETWKVLNLPLIWGYRREREKDKTETMVLSSLLGTVYDDTRHAAQKKREWEALATWGVALARGKQAPDGSVFTLVEGSTVYDSPLFWLWRTETKGEKSGNTQFLKLPFAGPLFAVWHDGDATRACIFPKLTLWKHCPESFKTIF